MEEIHKIFPGPRDATVLPRQEEHRSTALWRGEVSEHEVLTCRCYSDGMWALDLRAHRVVMEYGFLPAYHLTGVKIDRDLVTALVERWRPETHTFHMREGEMTITLQDVSLLSGLPIIGPAIAGDEGADHKAIFREVFGGDPPANKLKGRSLNITWLFDTFGGLDDDATDVQVRRHAIAWMLGFCGRVLFPDKTGKNVSLLFLQYLRHQPSDEHPAPSWGAAALAYLYRSLCMASKKGVKEIGGCLILLQIWAWERILAGVPDVGDDPQIEIAEDVMNEPMARRPFAHKWIGAKVFRRNPRRSVKLFRDSFDAGVGVIWEPYAERLNGMPQYCLPGVNRWVVRCPLICHAIVEPHCSDRVLRQFGMIQAVPMPYPFPDNWDAIHLMDGRGRHEVNWSVDHMYFIGKWMEPENVGTDFADNDPQRTEQELEAYMIWCRNITRLRVSRPTLQGEQPLGQPLEYQPRSGVLQKLVHTVQSMVNMCKCSSRTALDVASQQSFAEVARMGETCLLEVGEELPESPPEQEAGVSQRQPTRAERRGRQEQRTGASQGEMPQSQLTQVGTAELQRPKRYRRRHD